jgi:serine/threonine protein kinase/beta-lactam-binding protein with PASTA domain
LTAEIGRVLGGRYRLIAPIGIGASAQVYLADDVKLRRRVAVKMLHDALASEVDFLRRFRAEARAAAALNHPNVMAVYDWGDGETPFLVTEYLPGGSLRALLDQEARLSPAQALNIGLEAARALDYAHRRGFVHRDVKPANLLFGEDQRLRIADFGLARALAEAAWTEPQGAVLGTARYAAPEQAKGETLTGKADVYALALVLIEAVTGTVPFVADTTLGTLMARVDKPLVVSDELGPLQPILTGAGRADPEQRIDARALALGLLHSAKAMSRPAPLSLPGAMVTGQLFAVDADPTEQGTSGLLLPPGWMPEGEAAESDLQSDDLQLDPPPWVSSDGSDAADHDVRTDALPGGDGPTQSLPVTPTPGPAVIDLRGTAEEASSPGDGLDLADAAVAAPVSDSGPEVVEPVEVTDTGERVEPVSRERAAAAPGEGSKLVRVDGAVISPSAGGRQPAEPQPIVVGADDRADTAVHERRRWPWAVLVLVLLLGAGGVAAVVVGRRSSPTASAAAIELPVPSVDGLSPAQARTLLETAGWKVRESAARRDGSTAGQILAVSPAAGARLAVGRSVSLTVSAGQTMVAVPVDLVGRTYPEAQVILTAAGLVPAKADTPYDENTPENQVLAVAPGTRPELEKGATVALVVSKGPKPRAVPAGLVGDTVAAATAQVQAVQLRLDTVQVYNDTAPVGQIVAVSPRPGTSVGRGSTVTVQVSLGPQLAAVPSVAGAADLDAAVAILRSAGFAAGSASGPAAGKPTGTSPAAGTEVKPGSAVNISLG